MFVCAGKQFECAISKKGDSSSARPEAVLAFSLSGSRMIRRRRHSNILINFKHTPRPNHPSTATCREIYSPAARISGGGGGESASLGIEMELDAGDVFSIKWALSRSLGIILAPESACNNLSKWQASEGERARDFSRVISGNRSGHWTQSLTPPAPRAPQPALSHSHPWCLWWINSISCPGVWYWGGIHQTALEMDRRHLPPLRPDVDPEPLGRLWFVTARLQIIGITHAPLHYSPGKCALSVGANLYAWQWKTRTSENTIAVFIIWGTFMV